ncbi:MAG: hypothetical protein HOW97_23120, partial [Catenulispora sp.]|nr:hypothetical protein [Catenulispora sp.]
GHGRGGPGQLRAGFACQWCGDLLLAAAARTLDRLPGLRVRVLEIDHRDSLAALRAGTVDVQLTELPVTDRDVVAGPVVLRDRRALAVPRGHRLAQRSETGVVQEDLAGERLITVGEPADSAAHTFHYPRHTPSGRPIGRGPAVATWQDALVNVGAGRGVAPASMRAALYHARPGVAYVPIIDAPPVQYALLWLRGNDHVRMRGFARVVGEVAEAAEAAQAAEAAEAAQSAAAAAGPARQPTAA